MAAGKEAAPLFKTKGTASMDIGHVVQPYHLRTPFSPCEPQAITLL